MEPWQRIEPTISTKIDYHNVIVKTFKLPNGEITTRTIFLSEQNRSAGVIALTKDKKVIVARQYRPGPERFIGDIPGGYVDEGEAPEETARRELLEETGYQADAMTFLGEFDRGSYINGKTYYYLALDCEFIDKQQLDHDEFVSIELKTIPEFIEGAKKGDMTDPYAVLAAYDTLIDIQKRG